jgi:nitroreductase/Pyruvate/2-oxoacid:ferredoxin oxidoreductase delta subunit
MSKFMADDAKCNRCGMCVLECPACIIEMRDIEALPSWIEIGEELCINCGHCVAVCAPGAISLGTMKPEDCAPIIGGLLPSAEQVEHILKSRRSIRAYQEKPVPREMLAKLIDIARYAPSGTNSQPVQWLVIDDPKEVNRLARLVIDSMRAAIQAAPDIAATLHFDLMVAAWDAGIDVILRGAPHVIIAHAYKDMPLADQDCHIALTYLELAAYASGLGACWAGWLQMVMTSYPLMIEALQLPEGHVGLGAMMIGYPKHRFSRIPLRKEPPIIWR